jgi:hypothetical protein
MRWTTFYDVRTPTKCLLKSGAIANRRVVTDVLPTGKRPRGRPRKVRPHDPAGLAQVAAEESAARPSPLPPAQADAPEPHAETTDVPHSDAAPAAVPLSQPEPAPNVGNVADDVRSVASFIVNGIRWLRADERHPLRADPARRALDAKKCVRVGEQVAPKLLRYPRACFGLWIGSMVLDLAGEFVFIDDLDELWMKHVRGEIPAQPETAPAAEQTVDVPKNVVQMGGAAS